MQNRANKKVEEMNQTNSQIAFCYHNWLKSMFEFIWFVLNYRNVFKILLFKLYPQ